MKARSESATRVTERRPPIVKTNGSGKAHTNGKALEGDSLHVEELLAALQEMRAGNFAVRLSSDRIGLAGKIADTFNDIVAANQRMAEQLERVGDVVGKEGKTRQRVKFGLQNGAWGEMEISVNSLIDDLLWPTAEV